MPICDTDEKNPSTETFTFLAQFHPWFNFYFLLFHIHDHILNKKEQRKIKIEPIELNYNINFNNYSPKAK